MKQKTYTQQGKLMYFIFIPLIAINLFLFFQKIIQHSGQSVHYFALLSFLFLLLFACFYKLTIIISDSNLTFKMGVGIIQKTYPIKEIKSIKPHRNSVLNGWGVRVIPGGWLYNVSGFQSIELTFTNNSKIIRIGTNVPEEICSELNKIKK
jgi:hypothetical protein